MRTYFYERLSGHTAFRTEENKQRWLEARRAEKDRKNCQYPSEEIDPENHEQFNEADLITNALENENSDENMNRLAESAHASHDFEETINEPEAEFNTSSEQVATNESENQEEINEYNALETETSEQVINFPPVEDADLNGPA